jgi:RNA polymerase sigma-70 factor (sigma-E family)
MTARRISTPDVLPDAPAGAAVHTAAAHRGSVPAGQLVDELYRGHALRLTRMALLLVGDRPSAEDVVQEAFLGLFRGLGRLQDPDRAVAYLRASVLNGSRSVLRSRKRARLRRVTHDPAVWSAEAAALDGEDRRAVLQAVAVLPQRQREVLVLRYFLDLTDNEIAADLGVSRGTVVSTAARALASLAARARKAEQ